MTSTIRARYYLDRIYELAHIASRLCTLDCDHTAARVGRNINGLFLDAAASSGRPWLDTDPMKNAFQAICELSADLGTLSDKLPCNLRHSEVRDLCIRLNEMVRIVKESEETYTEFSPAVIDQSVYGDQEPHLGAGESAPEDLISHYELGSGMPFPE